MSTTSEQKFPPAAKFLAGMIITGVMLSLIGALAVPFIFPTETLWYKTGTGKGILLTAQMTGLLTLVLLLVQILLALRLNPLEQVFGGTTLLRWHRGNGVFLAGTALTHVMLVLVPEGLANLPLGWKFWPELAGAAVLTCVLATVTVSWWRTALHLNYQRWRLLHRFLGYLLPALLSVHVLWVSESFAGGLPRTLLLMAVFLLYLITALIRIRRGRNQTTPFDHPRRIV